MAQKSRKNITVEEPTIKTVNYISVAQYIRLSVEDSNGKGNSIENQVVICKGWFLHPNTYDCGSFVVN